MPKKIKIASTSALGGGGCYLYPVHPATPAKADPLEHAKKVEEARIHAPAKWALLNNVSGPGTFTPGKGADFGTWEPAGAEPVEAKPDS